MRTRVPDTVRDRGLLVAADGLHVQPEPGANMTNQAITPMTAARMNG